MRASFDDSFKTNLIQVLKRYPIKLDDVAQWYSWCLHLVSPTERKTFQSEVGRLPDQHLKLALPFNPIESEQRKAGNEGQEEEMKRSNTMSVHRSRDKHTQKAPLRDSWHNPLGRTSSVLTRVLHQEEGRRTLPRKITRARSPTDTRHFPAHLTTFFPRSVSTDTHAILWRKRRNPTIRTRSSHEFLATLSLTLDSVRSSLSPVSCTHVYVWVCCVFGPLILCEWTQRISVRSLRWMMAVSLDYNDRLHPRTGYTPVYYADPIHGRTHFLPPRRIFAPFVFCRTRG